MRIFLTGGTGYIGSAVLDALVRAGHRVDALVRNTEKAAQVYARGAHPVMGDPANAASYSTPLARLTASCGVRFRRGAQADAPRSTRSREPIRPALADLPPGMGAGPCLRLSESAPVNPIAQSGWRAPHETLVLDAASETSGVVVRPGVVWRLPRDRRGSPPGRGERARASDRQRGQPLAARLRRDLGELFLRLMTTPGASGIYHANDEGDERVNDLVAAIAEHVKICPSVRRVPLPEARNKMGRKPSRSISS